MTSTLQSTQAKPVHTARRAIVVDDHPVMAGAVANAVASTRVFETVESAHSLAEAFKILDGNPECSLAILDLHLGDADVRDTLTGMRERFPDVPVLVFSADKDIKHITMAFECGVRGYATKDQPISVLNSAIRLVLGGSQYIPPEAVQLLGFPAPVTVVETAAPPVRFSGRQQQVFELLLQGMPNKVIGSRLEMAEGTVKAHLNAVYGKLGVQTRVQAILRARQLGMA